MTARIERAGAARGRCCLCDVGISKGEVRVAEHHLGAMTGVDRSTDRFYHLVCALERRRQLASEALLSSRSSRVLVVGALPEVDRRDAKLAAVIRAMLEQPRAPFERTTAPLESAATVELLAQLEESPDDHGLLTVLGDLLHQHGDDRGELIALDLAGATDTASLARRNALREALSPPLHTYDSASWGLGFLRRVDLRFYKAGVGGHAKLFAHPSSRLLAEVHLFSKTYEPVTIPVGVLPRSVRSLGVHGRLAPSDPGLASLPLLEHVVVERCEHLGHPNVRWLELARPSVNPFAGCSPASLPRVTRLTIRGNSDVVNLLDRSGWLVRVAVLELLDSGLDETDIANLQRALDGRRLDRLDVTGNRLPLSCQPALARMCVVLRFADHARLRR